jgi:uncharacterized protein YkwD
MLMLGSNVSTTAAVPKPPEVVAAAAAVTAPSAVPLPPQVAPVATPVAAPVASAAPVISAPTIAVAATATIGAAQITDEEQRFIDLANYERAKKGLRVLRVDPLLIEVSRGHSKEMAQLNYFDHISPTPGMRTALNRYLVALGHRPTWAYIGENLFYCSIVDVNRGHGCLMQSKSHRDNILNPKFDRIGVGTYMDEKGEFWVTQMFLASTD